MLLINPFFWGIVGGVLLLSLANATLDVITHRQEGKIVNRLGYLIYLQQLA